MNTNDVNNAVNTGTNAIEKVSKVSGYGMINVIAIVLTLVFAGMLTAFTYRLTHIPDIENAKDNTEKIIASTTVIKEQTKDISDNVLEIHAVVMQDEQSLLGRMKRTVSDSADKIAKNTNANQKLLSKMIKDLESKGLIKMFESQGLNYEKWKNENARVISDLFKEQNANNNELLHSLIIIE